MRYIRSFLNALITVTLYRWLVFLYQLFLALLRMLRERNERKKLPHRIRHNVTGDCIPIKAVNYKRADPCIYSQQYLMQLGYAVTWDNPDIQLFEGNQAVSSGKLKAGTKYRIRATISNGSTEAPVVGMPVEFSYLDFGAGTVSVPIGQTSVDVGVQGGAHHPAFTEVEWTTPEALGHYCIQVKLIWADDSNPMNNLGQENTNVVYPASPAPFNFKVRNEDPKTHRYHITVDTYVLPQPLNCVQKGKMKDKEMIKYLNDLHRAENYPVPADWHVVINQNDFTLDPGQEMQVTGTIEPPNGFVGTKAFNFNVFKADQGMKFVGGVTIYVEQNQN